ADAAGVDDAQAHAAGARARQRLHVAAVGGHGGLRLVDGVGLEALAGPCLRHEAVEQLQQLVGRLAHPVPPTVILEMRRVGVPKATGTPCPSLPQMPWRVSKSLPSASMRPRTVGPSPTRLAPRTGRVISPFSTR